MFFNISDRSQCIQHPEFNNYSNFEHTQDQSKREEKFMLYLLSLCSLLRFWRNLNVIHVLYSSTYYNCVIQFYSAKHMNFSAQTATSYFHLLFTSLAEKELLEYRLRQFVYMRRINLRRRDELLKRFTISELDYVASTRGKETIRRWISGVSFPPFPDV